MRLRNSFRSGNYSNVAATTTHTHTPASFPLEEVFRNVLSMSRGLRHWQGTAALLTLVTAPTIFQRP